MSKLPQIKKKITSFLKKEEGSISKAKLLKGALLLGTIGIIAESASAVKIEQTEDAFYVLQSGGSGRWRSKGSILKTSFDPATGTITATHSHHANFV